MDEYKQRLMELEKASYDKFDTALLAVTTGAIWLTVDIVTKGSITNWDELWWVKLSWVSLVASILVQVASHLFAAYALRSKQKGTECWWTEKGRLTYLNVTALVSFFLGVGFFLLGLSNNLH